MAWSDLGKIQAQRRNEPDGCGYDVQVKTAAPAAGGSFGTVLGPLYVHGRVHV